jgi:hypothetical protein
MTIGEVSKSAKGGKRPARDPLVNYMGPKAAPFKCGHCKYFVEDNAPCKKVSDPVQSKGCCNLFQPS